MTKNEALKLALEALDSKHILGCGEWRGQQRKAIAAIKEALDVPETNFGNMAVQPVQKPVGHRVGFWCADLTCNKCYSAEFRFKHTTPQQRPWVGLTGQEQALIASVSKDVPDAIYRANAKLKEKNFD